jgi:flavodoxin I
MKILVVFGSLLGRTKRTALLIGKLLQDNGHEVVVKDVRNVEPEEFNDYELILLGSSTWDDGMLQYDFRMFFNKLVKYKFPDKKFIAFGLGGHKYPHFCTAVDTLESAIKIVEGNKIFPSLRLDFDHDQPMNKCDNEIINWTNELIIALKPSKIKEPEEET